MSTHRTGPEQGDEGFTLVELLIVLVIMPMIIGAIAAAIIVSEQNVNSTKARIGDTSNAQLTSAFYVRDVQGAQYVTTLSNVASGSYTSTSPQVCENTALASPTLVLALYRPPSTTTLGTSYNAFSVGYWQTGGTTPELVRDECTVSTTNYTASFTSGSEEVLSDDIGDSTVSATIAPSSFATGAGAGWTATTTSSGSVSDITISAAEPGSSYTYNLEAAPRETTSEGSGPLTEESLEILGTLNMGGSGSATITVDGNADVNNGFTTQGGESFTSTGAIDSNGSLQCLSGTVITADGSNVCGQPANAPAVTDPLASFLPSPAPTAVGTSQTCPISIPTSGSVTLNPGNYACELNASVHGGATIYLNPGVYEFQGGVAIGNGYTLAMSASAGSNGVLIYLPCLSGSCSESFNATKGGTGTCDICLAPLTAAQSQTYFGTTALQDVWLWQAATNRATDTLVGGTDATSLTGTAYAPDATVDFSGGGTEYTGRIICQNIDMSGGTALTATGS